MVEFFIAKRIHFDKKGTKQVSRSAVRIAIAGIALGLAVMILTVAILFGYKREIRAKVVGFGSHIQISNFDNNFSYETLPIVVSDSLLNAVASTPGVYHAECFSTKPGIIKTDTDFLGIVVKGVDKNYDFTFFKKNMIEGDVLAFGDSLTNQVLISGSIADKLHLKTGDSFLTYFVQKDVRMRKFTVSGIYRTNYSEYDNMFVLTDIRHIRKLNNWSDDQVGGIEVLVNNFDRVDEIAENLYFEMQAGAAGTYFVRTIKDLNPQVFNWLGLLDMNVWIIICLMLAVTGFTGISGLLILILERTNMIGILKALGATHYSIRKVFLFVSSFLVTRGMIIGNVVALLICFIQQYFHIFKLNPEIYYIDTVPVSLNIFYIVLLNIGTLLASMLLLILPSFIIAKINPARSIRFE
ncbi:MAG: ABC transporter permease [Candidatus Azobacteroides sp.]|nr:ABC transporter permease [Candidatus Azobacteroides sp.]